MLARLRLLRRLAAAQGRFLTALEWARIEEHHTSKAALLRAGLVKLHRSGPAGLLVSYRFLLTRTGQDALLDGRRKIL